MAIQDSQSQSIACLIGIAPWKRKRIRDFLSDGKALPIARTVDQAIALAQGTDGTIACWATRLPKGLVERATEAGVALWRIEDGFIRSIGLGADLHLPASIVLDRTGIYYDPNQPSDLEAMLESDEFSASMVVRAERLIAQIKCSRLTKYNLGGTALDLPQDRKIILILGQVEGDQSVLLGGGMTFSAIVHDVRRISPDAFIIFKPHPDVVAGLRRGEAQVGADLVAPNADLPALFDAADEVHVLSSLGGFEALLRGCEVHVYGRPFYAGWGLTYDRQLLPRRTRQLSLAQLVAGALIAYPLYCHPETGERIEVEGLVELLSAARAAKSRPSMIRRISAKAAVALAARRAQPPHQNLST